jgi:hypothetical protein
MRHAARSDDVQPEIVKALRAIGCCVYVLKLPLDLLVSVRRPGEHRTTTMLVECKDADGSLNQTQRDFISSWIGEVHIVKSPSEAVAAVLGQAMQ